MRVLVTGACGFVGSTLARGLSGAIPGAEVIGVDNFLRRGSETNRLPLREAGVRLFHGDVRSPSDLDALPPADWVIDAAADPAALSGLDGAGSRRLLENNLAGTVNTLEYCRRHGAGLVLLSTSRVYSLPALASLPLAEDGDAFRLDPSRPLPPGASLRGIAEEFSTEPPLTLYGASKRASELLALEYGEAFGLPVWVNRCGVLAGAGQFGWDGQGVFSYWVHGWREGRPLEYRGFGGRGLQVRDWLHPRDLLPLLARQLAPGASAPWRVFNVGGGAESATSLAALGAWCRGRFGDRPVASRPEGSRYDVPWLVLDASRARQRWGWEPASTAREVFGELALHAERNPRWLSLSMDG